VSGAPARYAIIGDPVAHSLSPRMQQAAFHALGLPATYEARRVTRAALPRTLEMLRAAAFAGWNVTTPLKEAIIPLLDGCTSEAQAARSVNTVRRESSGRYVGHDTDGAGLVRAVRAIWDFDVAGKSVVLFGSGPASRAIARALRSASVGKLRCWSRNAQASAAIAPAPDGVADLVVSLLPAGATVPPEALSCIGGATRVFDANYASAGASVPPGYGGPRSDGLPLLLHQGALAFEWWTGGEAPLGAMTAALAAPLKLLRPTGR